MRCVLALLIGAASLTAAAQTVAMPEVSLEPHNGKTHFYLGETIRLDMVFRNTTGTPMMLNGTDYDDMSDAITISPTEGWIQWRGKSGHDFATVQTLTSRAQRVAVRVNDGYVIRKPGHYEIRVTEQRVTAGTMAKAVVLPATLTNEVGIDVDAMPEDMEAESLREIQNDLANAPEGSNDSYRIRQAAFHRLATLQGDEALAEKIRTIVHTDWAFRSVLSLAMASTNNLQHQLDLLHATWLAPNTSPNGDVLEAMNQTRRLMAGLPIAGWQMVYTPQPTDADKKLAAAQRKDMEELLGTMPQRTGKSRTDAAYLLALSTGLTSAQQQQAREYALDEFPHMDEDAQDALLDNATIRDVRMMPQIRAQLQKTPTYRAPLNAALMLTSGDEQKQLVINAICAHGSPIPLDYIAVWHGDRLPEVDTCLAEKLKTPEEGFIGSAWSGNALLAARYATPAILPQIKQGWQLPSQDAVMLAVLTRMAPPEAVALMNKLSTQPDIPLYQTDIVLDAMHLALPPEELAWLRTRLPAAPVQQERAIAYQLSHHGDATDEPLLEKQLFSLRKAWADHASAVDTAAWNTPEGAAKTTERELMNDLTHATAWKLSAAQTQSLVAGCMTTECRQIPGRRTNP